MPQTRLTQLNHPPGFIDLGSGNPDPALFPLDLLQKAAESYFAAGDLRTLQYGAEAGNGDFLAELAGFLSGAYRQPVEPGSLFATTGASAALDLLCTLCTRAGDVIFVEEPSYFLALRIFADHGLRVIAIPMDRQGLQVDRVAELLKEYKPKFVYTIPTFHNPASLTLSQARREQLVRLAEQHGFLLIADEVYHFLPYTVVPPQPFAVFTRDLEQVVSVQSFSKILAPGLRLGWIQAHEKAIRRLAGCGLLDSGGGMNPFTSAIVRYLLESGDLARNIAALRKAYRLRLAALTAALDRHLPEAAYSMPQGGFFAWVRLPGVDTVGLRQAAQQAQVDFRPGALFSSQGGLKEYLRLSCSYYNPQEIERGVARLAEMTWQGPALSNHQRQK
jgi:DNA-binding transcriptional MocR family regulator